jgi:predicted glycogen debranching enzyme
MHSRYTRSSVSTEATAAALHLGREVCGHLSSSARREWLVTNGLGGYASGTVAGLLTRRYHGLLIAALKPPLGRTLLLTKLDATATYDDRPYLLYTDRWVEGHVEPAGFRHLERFHMEGTTPVWTFACADALLERRVWMQPGSNTSYIRYDLRRASAPLVLTIRAMINYRAHHGNTHAGDWKMHIEPVAHGLCVMAFGGATPFFLLSDGGEVVPHHAWYRRYYLSLEAYRGLDALDDNLDAGTLRAELRSGEYLTVVASTEPSPSLDGARAYAERQAREQRLIAESGYTNGPACLRRLVLAADQFIALRTLGSDAQGKRLREIPGGSTVIAGYPWFGDWGRDTMISLPGLALCTGRHDVAASILRTFAEFVDQGMLPNRFPGADEPPEYNTADASLWYIEAVRAFHVATGDDVLLGDLFPVLGEIIRWYLLGTRYGVHADPVDGLIWAGEPGTQLTWMDAKVSDWVVTPRIGKPVEVNALWYNALRSMAVFAHRLGEPGRAYEAAAEQVQAGFAGFWNESAGYCYDLLDGPEGHDASLRPNQLFAVSLTHSPLPPEQQRAVVDVCARALLTSHGLRSLAPDDPAYVGRYGGDQRERDAAYHRGTVWAWLMGPFVSAHLRVYCEPRVARSYLEPLIQHLEGHGMGTISEIFDGEPPFAPRGCMAQAWSVAEIIRAWQATEKC